MSISASGKKQCVTCSKSGGIMTCDGCEQSFCGKHSIEHRRELTDRLDGIMHEHDLLQQEFGQPSIDNYLFKQINKWEKESITKIQVAAEAARADLHQILGKSKENISKACRDIAVNLRSSREADDFSENDLTRSMKQLKQLKLEYNSPSSITLIEDQHATIPLVKIEHDSSATRTFASNNQLYIVKNPTSSVTQERFSTVFGAVLLEKESTIVRHNDDFGEYAHILGERLYTQGHHVMRFRVEYEGLLYNTFLAVLHQ